MKVDYDRNLFFVEKLLGIVPAPNGKHSSYAGVLRVKVKWHNYSYRETTLENLEEIKKNPNLREEAEKL
jgi:hypothetical protein